jgi:hypothetical protein
MSASPYRPNHKALDDSRSDQLYTQPNEYPKKRHHVRKASSYPSTIRLLLGHLVSFLEFLLCKLFGSNNLPLLLNCIYHGFLARQFIRKPCRYLQNHLPQAKPETRTYWSWLLNRRPDPQISQVNPPQIATDILKYLGGVQLALSVLSLLALKLRDNALSSQKVVLLVLATADGSRAWFDVKHWKDRTWNGNILQEIAGGSLLFTVMNIVAYGSSVRKSGALL